LDLREPDFILGPDEAHFDAPLGTGECTKSLYRQPVSPEEARQLCPSGDGGLIWHAQVVDDDYLDEANMTPSGDIKPRRANLMVRSSDFFASLVHTPDGRWCFSGVLNGWPALRCLELRSITCKVVNLFGQARIERQWQAGDPDPPNPPAGYTSVRSPTAL